MTVFLVLNHYHTNLFYFLLAVNFNLSPAARSEVDLSKRLQLAVFGYQGMVSARGKSSFYTNKHKTHFTFEVMIKEKQVVQFT